MSDKKEYHKHIELAIQNVLSKVKAPDRPFQPKDIAPKQPDNLASNPVTESLKPEKDTMAKPEEPIPAAENDRQQAETELDSASDELEPVYLEAEDLFTPFSVEPQHAESETDETDELPLIEDSYTPPYNLFEEFVETELNILLSRYLDLCRCSQCRTDIVALALQQLPAYYVTGTRGTLTAKSVIWTRYTQEIMAAVTKSINIVYKRPRNTCRKIKQVLWVRPDLEDISHPQQASSEAQLFANVSSNHEELIFSPEVAAIIQTLENMPGHESHDLLPASSPVIHQTFDTPSEASPPDLPEAQDSPVKMELLEMDEWENF